MKISEMLQAFHSMQACDRMDLICRMLRHCVPYESRFLGTVLLDASREHYKSHVNRIEINANRVNYYATFQESGLTHEVCEKLCCALAVVHSDNHPVAEAIFNLLNDKKVLNYFEECNDLKALQDYRLLYVMAVNHPALSFNQRQLIMYNYLQRMDLVYIEKSKYSFSGSFSGSVEKTMSGETDSSKYPPEVQFISPAPDAYITRCEVHSVYKRPGDKRYVYMIQVEWSDGATYTVRRTYGDFFSFQTKLLDLFPEEGGQKGKKHPRLIPYLPGKNYQRFLKNKETAEKRLPELHRYSRELISLPERIQRSQHVLEFYRPRPSDKEEYPPLHKITTLYDLIESGKHRSRVFSEPLRGSPTHSPVTHPRGSPLQRASLTASAEVSPSTPPRISQTLPPPAHTPPEASNEAIPPVIPRRPTYPLHKSAFRSVLGAASWSEEDLVSNTTLANSEMSITASDTTSSHLSSTASLTALTPTTLTPTSKYPPHPSQSISTLPPPHTTSEVVASNENQVVNTISSFSQDHKVTKTTTQATSTIGDTPISSTDYTTEVPSVPRHPVAVLPHQQNCIQQTISNPNLPSAVTQLFPVGQVSMLVSSSSPQTYVPNANNLMYSHGGVLLNARGEVVVATTQTSPTMISSPLLTSVRPTVSTPSPPLSGTTTPHGGILVGTAGYPSSQIVCNIAPPYSPIPTYPFFNGSPLASPVPSPKTPKMNKLHGSYSAVNRASNEHDSLIRWLKSLRLHKYYSIFENVTFEEMCSMSVEQLETRGMTQGAAKKLFRKLEELKRSNFTGFRDMPIAAGMSRKPSTCSLPASLLMERGLTPSSSFEGFSPTGSTCSLDKFGSGPPMGRTPTPSQQHHTQRHSAGMSDIIHDRQQSRSSCNSAVIEDTAILKVVPAGRLDPSFSPPSCDVGVLLSESPISSTPKPGVPCSSLKKVSQPVPQTTSIKSNHLSGSNLEVSAMARPDASPTNSSSHNSSWADQVVPNEDHSVNSQPDWAQMPVNGEVKIDSPIPQAQNHLRVSSGGVPDTHHIIPIRTNPEQSNPFQKLTPQEWTSSSNAPSRLRHIPVAKRNSSEGYIPPQNNSTVHPERVADPSQISHHVVGNSGLVTNSNNWNPARHVILPSNVSVIRTSPNLVPHPQQHIVHRVSPQYSPMNGVLKTTNVVGRHPTQQHHTGLIAYGGGRLINHRQDPPPPVTCFNCGKRGHIGTTCPANTMETNNPNTFHKKLEKIVHASNKPPVL